MFYVLDTNICRLVMEKDLTVSAHIDALSEDDTVCTTMISFGESVGGWLPFCRRARNGEERAKYYTRLYEVFTFYRRMVCMPFDENAAEIFDQLRARKTGVKTNDLAIAATALSIGGIVITRNTVDFGRVPGLRIEDWAK